VTTVIAGMGDDEGGRVGRVVRKDIGGNEHGSG